MPATTSGQASCPLLSEDDLLRLTTLPQVLAVLSGSFTVIYLGGLDFQPVTWSG